MNPMATTSWATSMDSEFSPALPSASARSRRRMLEARAPRDSRILAPSSATRARAADRSRSSSMRSWVPSCPRASQGVSPRRRATSRALRMRIMAESSERLDAASSASGTPRPADSDMATRSRKEPTTWRKSRRASSASRRRRAVGSSSPTMPSTMLNRRGMDQSRGAPKICMSPTTAIGAVKAPSPMNREVSRCRSRERPTTDRSVVRKVRSTPVRRAREAILRLRTSAHGGIADSEGLSLRASSRIRPSLRRVSNSASAAAGWVTGGARMRTRNRTPAPLIAPPTRIQVIIPPHPRPARWRSGSAGAGARPPAAASRASPSRTRRRRRAAPAVPARWSRGPRSCG